MVYPSGTARVPTYYTSGRLAGYQDAVRWTDSTLVCPDIDITSCYWQVSSGTTVQHAGSYSYDKVGNRTDTASVGAANQLSTFHGFTMTYDADGNMTSKSGPGLTQTLHWTVLGQLDTVTTSGSVTTFAYDAMGRRIRKTGPGGTINYLLDGGVLIAELDNSWLPIREYSYYPGTDRPHSVRKAGQVYYYLYEEPGHVIGLVNTSNQLVNQYTYEPFGAALTTSESVAQPFRFTARELDAETGLYYYRARYYDPQLARFVSEDPAGLAGGINRYTYVEGDPVNYTDPSGMQKCAWVPGAWWSSYLNGTTVNTWVDPYWLCDEDTSGYGPQLSDRGGEQQIGPIVGGGSSTALKVPLPKPTKKACAGNFHLLQGNSATINNPKMPGGFSGTSVVLVSPNSAAIIQSQWNSDRAALRRYRNEVSGDFPGAGASFQGLSDFIGGGQAHRPSGCAAGKPVSQCLMEKYPNQIFVELPSAPHAFLVTPFAGTVMVPDYAPCPHP